MTQIQPTNLGLPPIEAIAITIRAEFNLGGDSSRVFWRVFDVDNNQLLSGNLYIPSLIHNAWGVDDSVVEDYVLTQLNLDRL
jgi:hypothetical protein